MERQIITADGKKISYAPESGAHYELEELQNIVGGYIQVVDLQDGRLMICNEEGKLNGLPFNQSATDIALEANAIFENDFIVGNVLVCKKGDIL